MKFIRTVKQLLQSDSATGDITLSHTNIIAPHILEVSTAAGYLTGQMLVATPLVDSGVFHKSVIYVFAHTAEGAMGLIINQPIEKIGFSSLVEGMELSREAASQQVPVFFGGPVERARGFVIHSTDYFREFSLARSAELAVTASSAILSDMAEGRGPRHAALVVGCAGWGAGQLEAEIEANSWITVPATAELMFGTENELKWISASKSLGIDMTFFSPTVGHA